MLTTCQKFRLALLYDLIDEFSCSVLMAIESIFEPVVGEISDGYDEG
ncbi:MAG: hypothetical protein HNEKOMLI_00463 [Sodalis sp. Psp]|nr:hypothetical protein [Sodalis sp. Psp]MCR3756939.1 hypothetical protein [Sodalis sp. Ppy]